jgi:hypothetical protein
LQQDTFVELTVIMSRLAAGDRAAVFTLYERFGAAIAGSMRGHLRRLGVTFVEPAELDGMVIDACVAVFGCASGWDPDGGGLPWTWAGHRLAGVAQRWLGIRSDSFDASSHDVVEPAPAGTTPDTSEWEVLASLAGQDHLCALLVEALETVASPRDRALLLELRAQTAEGDPSPALTVGRRFSMAPDAVRQVGSRVRRRVRDLAAREDRFAPLADIPLVA